MTALATLAMFLLVNAALAVLASHGGFGRADLGVAMLAVPGCGLAALGFVVLTIIRLAGRHGAWAEAFGAALAVAGTLYAMDVLVAISDVV